MGEDTISFIVSLRGGAEAASEMGRVKTAVSEAGGQIREVGEQSRVASTHTGTLGGAVRKLAYAFVALGAGYKVYNAAKTAITYTKDLTESSKALSNATGLNISESSRYVGVAGALGVSSGQLNVAFKSLATQVEKGGHVTHTSADESRKHALVKLKEKIAVESLDKRLAKGTITAKEYGLQIDKMRLQSQMSGGAAEHSSTAFSKLGISQEWIAKHGKDFNAVILEVTKRLNEMPGSTEKTKIETELFGRSWAALNPLLGEGSDHLEHVLGLAKKFGVELHGGINKELEQLREAQLESTLASDGLRIAFTKTAAGPMINLLKGFARLKNAARLKDWGTFNKELDKVFVVAGHVIETFEVRSIEGFGQLAPKLLGALWRGFQHSSLPNKALMVGIIASKLGLTGAVFGGIGKAGVRAMGKAVAGEAGTAALGAAGAALGTAFGVAFTAVATAAIVALAAYAAVKLGEALRPAKSEDVTTTGQPLDKGAVGAKLKREHDHMEAIAHGKPWHENAQEKADKRSLGHPVITPAMRHKIEKHDGLDLEAIPTPHFHLAQGGRMARGGLVEVGERGPELLNLPTGASVTPLKPGSMAQGDTYLVVDGKVLGRALRRQAMLSQAAGA